MEVVGEWMRRWNKRERERDSKSISSQTSFFFFFCFVCVCTLLGGTERSKHVSPPTRFLFLGRVEKEEDI